RGHAFAGLGLRIKPDESLPGRDADSELESLFDREVANRQRGSNRTLRVVLVSGRRAEERHHSVADELLDRAAVALEFRPNPLVVRAEEGVDVLGIERLGARGEADEVAEDDRNDLALAALR